MKTNNNKIKRIRDGEEKRSNKNNSKTNNNCVSIIPAKMLTDNRLDKVKEAESIEKDSGRLTHWSQRSERLKQERERSD